MPEFRSRRPPVASKAPPVSRPTFSFARLFVAVVAALVVASVTHAAQGGGPEVQGLVVDALGAAVPGAIIRLEAADGTPLIQLETGADGRFARGGLPPGEIVVRAFSPGFAETTLHTTASTEATPLHIVLQPAPYIASVTVTASRGAVGLETPAATTVLTSAELLVSGATMIDDVLRNTPGFSLFRRSSSRVSTPPSQGVTLRGVSGSGASRTLVLVDGLPLNDAFGSWVYWDRIPIVAIERVEVVRGASGDLYGANAMGGVIQLLTFTPGRPRLRAMLEGASYDTVRSSVFAGGQARRWTGSAAGEWLDTAGVVRIARAQRGAMDTPVTSDYRTAFATVGYDTGAWRGQARAAAYTEDRSRGTPLQVDDTTWRQFSGEVAGTLAGGAALARVAGGSQEFFNNFSSISSNRGTELLTREQRIPSTFATFGGQWARMWGPHAVLLGGEGRRTKGTVHETRYSPAGLRSGPFLFGGTEVGGSVFGRASLAATDRVTIMVGGRGDFWRSTPRDSILPEHAVNFFSPSASLSWQASPEISVRTAAYQAYRTPTLNELHRGFRVGDIVTDGNPLLDPERLRGVEGSMLWARPRMSARVTGFWNIVDDLVTNVTLTVTPTLITRQKQNADTVRAAGVEIEADVRPTATLTLNALAAFTASHFAETPKQPALEGKRVPQVPLYQFGAGVTFAAPAGFTVSAQFRLFGAQFDDDQNEFELGRYAVMDGYLSRTLGRGLQAFVAVENVFDTEYDVGRTPVRTVGWPRTLRGGVRFFLP